MYMPVRTVKTPHGDEVPRHKVQNIVMGLVFASKQLNSSSFVTSHIITELVGEDAFPTFAIPYNRRRVYQDCGLLGPCGVVPFAVLSVFLATRFDKEEHGRHVNNWLEDHWPRIEPLAKDMTMDNEWLNIMTDYHRQRVDPKRKPPSNPLAISAQYEGVLYHEENKRVVRPDWVKRMEFFGLRR